MRRYSARELDDFLAILEDPTAREHMSVAVSLGIAEPDLYEVASVQHA